VKESAQKVRSWGSYPGLRRQSPLFLICRAFFLGYWLQPYSCGFLMCKGVFLHWEVRCYVKGEVWHWVSAPILALP